MSARRAGEVAATLRDAVPALVRLVAAAQAAGAVPAGHDTHWAWEVELNKLLAAMDDAARGLELSPSTVIPAAAPPLSLPPAPRPTPADLMAKARSIGGGR